MRLGFSPGWNGSSWEAQRSRHGCKRSTGLFESHHQTNVATRRVMLMGVGGRQQPGMQRFQMWRHGNIGIEL